MDVLGISCFYHDAAACLVRDGRIVSAAQEERFDRIKHSPGFPIRAINSCLEAGDSTALDLDCVGFYEKPYLKLGRTLISHLKAWPLSGGHFLRTFPDWLARRLTLPIDIERDLGFKGPVLFVPHHLAHAASAFLPSPFEEAAILTADGLGEWATTCYGVGRGSGIQIRRELHYPDSLGLLYSAITAYLGFRANSDEGRVMALAALGRPSFAGAFRRVVDVKDDGSFHLNPGYFEFLRGRRMFRRKFVRAFGAPRQPGDPIEDRHRDLAATLQALVEDILVKMARTVHAETGMTRLCAAGGVFLNCVANTRLIEETPFTDVFIPPAAGDAGGALGVSLCLSQCHFGAPRGDPMTDSFLGPGFTTTRMRRALDARGILYRDLPEAELAPAVAALLARGRVVGWFNGRMEFGPRALGARSILASPCRPGMKDHLNARVKHRESFRPYGVLVPEDRVGELFEPALESPFMLLVARARDGVGDRIPSALHVDGTSRLQTLTRDANGPILDVVCEFGRLTGVPVVINTSFNDHGEPIVCTPEDACDSYLRMEIDALVLGTFLAEKPETSSRGEEVG